MKIKQEDTDIVFKTEEESSYPALSLGDDKRKRKRLRSRASHDSNHNHNHNPPLPTVAVAQAAQPTSVRVRQDGSNDDTGTVVQVQVLRRSTRTRKRKRKGDTNSTPQSLDTTACGGGGGGGDGGSRTGPSKKTQKRRNRNQRAPEVDLSHLGGLPEYLAEDLDVLFCGINPGRTSATVGHHYANGTNHFWPCLHLSGFTPRRLSANEDSVLPEMYNLGLTNLVERPSISEAHLLNQEMASSVPALLAKIARWRPRVICFNGKGIWLHVERSLQRESAAAAAAHVPKREDEELKPIIDMDQERPVKTERVITACSLSLQQQQPPLKLKKDTSNDGVALRERSASGARSSTTANSSSNLDPTGRILRPSILDTVPIAPGSAAASRPSFVYGIQPYKAVHHDVAPKNASVRETLFCVFPSSSGRVVSHQRNDKVLLFKKLREDLELIKAGTFDTDSMQLVRLQNKPSERSSRYFTVRRRNGVTLALWAAPKLGVP